MLSKETLNRILKQHELGNRNRYYTKEMKKEMVRYVQNNSDMSMQSIARHFGVSDAVICRACRKYGIQRGHKSVIPQEKIQQIISLYKENPSMRFSDVMKKANINEALLKRVRRDCHLMHLGYKSVFGPHHENAKIVITYQR